MGFKLLDFYKISPPVSGGETDPERSVRFKRIRLPLPDMAFIMFVV